MGVWTVVWTTIHFVVVVVVDTSINQSSKKIIIRLLNNKKKLQPRFFQSVQQHPSLRFIPEYPVTGREKGSYKWRVMWWRRLQQCQLALWDGWLWKLLSGKPWCTDLVWLLSHCAGPPVTVLLCHCWTLILHPPQQWVSVRGFTEIKCCDSPGSCVFTALWMLNNLGKVH